MHFKLELNDEKRKLMRTALEALGWLAAVCLLAFASHAVFAQSNNSDNEDLNKSRERRTQQRDARDLTPTSLMRDARTLFIRPTRHLDKTYLEYKLQKHRELAEWELMLVDDERAADLVVQIEKTALNYIFTIIDPRTRAIVTSGKTVAINGLVAAENLGREIVKKIRVVRAGPDRKSKKKRDEEDDGWSES